MSAPFVFRRAVRFEEIDAAGYVYFPKIAALAHEAIEHLLEIEWPDGGYARMVRGEGLGLPCVHLACDFRAPLRFGDTIAVALAVVKIGTSSVTFDVEVRRGDDVLCAKIVFVVACSELVGPSSRPVPTPLRAILSRYAA